MDLKHAVVLLLLVSSMILCFFSSTYAVVFVAASSLFAFMLWNEEKKASDLTEMKQTFLNELETLKKEQKQLRERVDQYSLGRLGK